MFLIIAARDKNQMTIAFKSGIKAGIKRICKLKQESFRDIISGRHKGIPAVLPRLGLGIASIPYSLAIRLRNAFYNHHIFKIQTVRAPVISIGNITAGGTGKTPLVAHLVKHLAGKYKPAILTRGYKSNEGISDEATLLAQRYPGIPVIVNPDRVAGAKEAIAQGANVLVMDDGFQHRRLGRDLDIVTIDATEPFGFGRLLPAGFLREPVRQIGRADAVVITRANQSTDERIELIKQTIRKHKADMPIACAVHRCVSLNTADGGEMPPEKAREKKVFAYCGIGNPEAFFGTLEELGVNLAGRKIYPDHYHYTGSDVSQIVELAHNADAELVVTTEKDWIKSSGLLSGRDKPYFAYLTVELEFIEEEGIILGLIDRTAAGKINV